MALLMNYWVLDLVALLAILIAVFYLYMTRNFNYWTKRGVAQIPPIPFIGNFKEIMFQQKSGSLVFRDWYEKYVTQPYVGFYVLDRPYLMIRDPEIIKLILIKDADYFQNRHAQVNVKDALGTGNLFFIRNPAWKYLRAKLTPVYTGSKLRKMFELMIDVCKDLETFLEGSHLDEGKVLEVKELCAKFTTDMIATTAYGIKADSLNNPEAEFRKNGRKILELSIPRGLELFAIFFAPQFVQACNVQGFHDESREFLRSAIWITLNEREKSGIVRNDLIDLLIELRRNQSEEEKKIVEIDGDTLVAQAAVFFTAGFETSSTLMSFCLYELAVNPDIQEKLRGEINDALRESGGKITYEMATSGLPYLDAVVAETLRIYPPLPYLDREATSDYKVPGSDLVLEKGTPVLIPMLGLHFDEEYFPDPKRFNPDNFSEENKKARKSCVYLPFGDGPHACIGLRLGLIQSKIGIITILANYEVSPCKETLIPMKMSPKTILSTPDGGLYLNLRKLKA